MGWYFSPQSKSALIEELTAPRETDSARTVTIAYEVCGDALWSVVEVRPKTSGEPQRTICCDLLDCHNGMWGHKPLEEAMHPFHYSCPLPYLKMAPEQSRAWRDNVRAWHMQHRTSISFSIISA